MTLTIVATRTPPPAGFFVRDGLPSQCVKPVTFIRFPG